VRLHDDLGKTLTALARLPAEESTPQRFLSTLEGFGDDVELLLGQHGVERFEHPGDTFEPRRQTALRTEATDDPVLVGTVAVRLRPGFAQGETLLQKERVAVYVASGVSRAAEA
jgi:molecular chaperone GrpE (heat shock protein)